jgi:predicted amidohydrolase
MNSEILQYNAAAIQTDFENPLTRREMKKNSARVLELIELAVIGYKPFLPVKLLVFPEFAHAAPVYDSLRKLREKLGVEIPNEHTRRVVEKARELDVYVQMGSMLEIDPKYPNALFNTACLVGPEGILYKYRKVYPWLPWEVHTSPHDIPDYEEPMFPVADTRIGKLGTAICYDWLFPETLRQLTANGAEVLLRVSAYMDPFGATPPNDWWTVVNRCRALENTAFVVAANQAASLRHYPPFSWPGGSMIVDYDGRIVAQATPGDGEKITVAPVDVSLLRKERTIRSAHQMLLHFRSEAHPMYERSWFPGGQFVGQEDLGYDDNMERTRDVRNRVWPEPPDGGEVS